MGPASSICRPRDHFHILPPVKVSYVFFASCPCALYDPGAKAITHSVLLDLSADLASATNTATKKVNIYLERGIDTAVELFLTCNCLILNFSNSRRNYGSSDTMDLSWVLMVPTQ